MSSGVFGHCTATEVPVGDIQKCKTDTPFYLFAKVIKARNRSPRTKSKKEVSFADIQKHSGTSKIPFADIQEHPGTTEEHQKNIRSEVQEHPGTSEVTSRNIRSNIKEHQK